MRLKDLVEMLFGGVPYFREAAAAQETIEASEAGAGECARRAGSGYGQRDDQMGYAAAAAGLLMGFNRMTRPLRLERVRLDAGAAEYLRREEDRNAKRLLDAVWLLGAAMGGIITVYRLSEAELPQFEIMWITCAVWVGTGLVLLKNMLLYRTATGAFIPDGRRKNLII